MTVPGRRPILVVCLNAGIDKTLTVPGFRTESKHYATEITAVAGGKGVNVARVLRTLGCPVQLFAFRGGHNGGFVADDLQRDDIAATLVDVPGESRLCLTILQPGRLTPTEVNEPGRFVPPEAVEQMLAHIESALPGAPMIIMSGSLPPGVPPTIYATLTAKAAALGVPAIVDAKGDELIHALSAGPLLIKPNQDEASGLVGQPVRSAEDAARHLADVLKRGTRMAIVSLGGDGAVGSDGRQVWHAAVDLESIVNPVGSGDSLVAAFASTWLEGGDFAAALKMGVAAGAANALVVPAGGCSAEAIRSLLGRVRLSPLNYVRH